MSTKVIIDKQNGGKSLKAEGLAVSCGKPLYYLATMKVMDEDGRRRVEKHRKQREGKGFVTIECEYDIRRIPDVIRDLVTGQAKDHGLPDEEKCTKEQRIKATVLLECVANLVGNELFDNPDRPWSADPMKVDKEEFARTIIDDIRYLKDRVANLIIVSSEYETDDTMDNTTRLYLSLLDMINQRIQVMSESEYITDEKNSAPRPDGEESGETKHGC